jgi:hypothetical protein
LILRRCSEPDDEILFGFMADMDWVMVPCLGRMFNRFTQIDKSPQFSSQPPSQSGCQEFRASPNHTHHIVWFLETF